MRFECRMVERRNSNGEVTAHGAEWCEPHRMAESAMFKLGEWGWKLGFYVAFFGIIFGLLLRVEELAAGGIMIGVGVFAVGTALLYYGGRTPGTPRTLLFRHDGFLFSPTGVAGMDSVGKWKVRHQDIMNIEAVQTAGLRRDEETEYTHSVRLLMSNGKKYTVASHLAFDDAAEVVTCLMTALMMVRGDVSIEVGDLFSLS